VRPPAAGGRQPQLSRALHGRAPITNPELGVDAADLRAVSQCHRILVFQGVHRTPAMRCHRSGRNHRFMDAAPALYLIRINGLLGATLLTAFPQMASRQQGAHTVLTGPLDHSALHGVLAEIDALGLDLLEVRQLTAGAKPTDSLDDRSS
jgi:hypothetical protein